MKSKKHIIGQWIKRKSYCIPHIQKCYACSSSQNTKITIEKGETTSETFYYDLTFMYDIFHKKGCDKINRINISYEKGKASTQKGDNKFITIVLNNILHKYAYRVILNTNLLVCADGGANRLYDLTLKMIQEIDIREKEDKKKKDAKHKPIIQEAFSKIIEEKEDHRYSLNLSEVSHSPSISTIISNLTPNLICGDFDSITKNVYEFYKQRDFIQIEKDSDTLTTDFDKCLNKIKSVLNENDKIIVLGSTGNRFDHTCANISTLYRNISLNHIYLLGENNFLFLLKKGNNIIHIDRRIFNKMCGIIPIGEKCKVTTTGLKYNLNNEQLSFCHLISTSNEIVNDQIRVSSTAPILWFSELKPIID